MCFDQHVLKVYTVQAVNSSAGAIITPHVTTSLAPASVLQAGEGCTARKVISPGVHLVCPLLADPEYCNSFVLFQFVYLVHMGSDALSDATVLVAHPVTMWPGSVAAHLDLLVTAASEVSDYILISLHSWWNISDSLSVVKHWSCCPCCVFLCSAVCLSGTFGLNCNQVCQCSEANQLCHPVTGVCYCAPGYQGIKCDTGVAFMISHSVVLQSHIGLHSRWTENISQYWLGGKQI